MWQIDKFENLRESGLVICVCLDLVSMHLCVRYEGSMIKYIGRRGNYSEIEK